ncbi:MAG TPA: SDR family oxidoreductase, partial [Chloroflexia bacterium]|nr:SDR family oxidoreductase [Chloroflexia bacterium]
ADRVVVITGATGGLGRVVTQRMAAEGARLALLGTQQDRLDALAAEFALPGDRVLLHVVDMRDAGAAQAAADAVRARFERADILLHLVGGWAGGTPVTGLEAETVADMLQQHLWTTLNLMQGFVPGLVEQGWGRVIAVSSPFAARPQAKGAAYAVGKAAQEALFGTLAEEVGGTGVTANLLLARTIDVKHERDTAPTGKNAGYTTPEEIAAAIVFLCSAEAGTINGARIPLYGRA